MVGGEDDDCVFLQLRLAHRVHDDAQTIIGDPGAAHVAGHVHARLRRVVHHVRRHHIIGVDVSRIGGKIAVRADHSPGEEEVALPPLLPAQVVRRQLSALVVERLRVLDVHVLFDRLQQYLVIADDIAVRGFVLYAGKRRAIAMFAEPADKVHVVVSEGEAAAGEPQHAVAVWVRARQQRRATGRTGRSRAKSLAEKRRFLRQTHHIGRLHRISVGLEIPSAVMRMDINDIHLT